LKPAPFFLFGELMHDLLFRESAAALQEVADPPRLLGAELGFVGVLHTWGRQLQRHPHVHYIVPGGGLSADGNKWIAARQRDWLLPVAKLAAVFRRRLEEALRAEAPALPAAVSAGTWRRPWIVHSQPAGSGANVVKYLARYVGRTAISAERIVEANDDTVTFKYTDSATQERKQSTVSADEFMRRYLQHVLPPGQHRVRYFGWMHPAAKMRRLKIATLLAVPIVVVAAAAEEPKWHLRVPALRGVRSRCRRDAAPPRARPACLHAMKFTPRWFGPILRRPVKHVVSDSFARHAQNVRRRAGKAHENDHNPAEMPAEPCAIARDACARAPFGSIAVPPMPIQNA